jgi:DNA-binding transcriptional LysR family regulator
VELSDAGHALLPEARRTLEAAQAARDAVEHVRGGLRGSVVLGTMQAAAMHAVDLPRILATFRATHPGVTVTIRHAGGSATMADQVRDGPLDLAFVALPSQSWPGIELRTVSSEAMSLAVAADHPLAQRATITLAELQTEAMTDLPPGWGTRMSSDQAFAAAGLTRTIAYEVNDTTSIIDFVRHGIAVALLPPSFLSDLDDISVVPIRRHVPQFEVALATPSLRRLSAAASALLDTIQHTT